MKHLKKFNEDIALNDTMSTIIGNSVVKISKDLFKSNTGTYIYLPSVLILYDEVKVKNYSFNELKKFTIIDSYKSHTQDGIYESRIFEIFELGNISGRMDIEVIFVEDMPLLAILVEADSEIVDDIITIMEDYKEDISFDLLKLRSDILKESKITDETNENMGYESYPRKIQLRVLTGELNSFSPRVTDCSYTADMYMREMRNIEEKLKNVTTIELVNMYHDYLNKNGIYNMTRYFSKTFNKLEKKHNEDPDLSIWDFRNMKKLYSA